MRQFLETAANLQLFKQVRVGPHSTAQHNTAQCSGMYREHCHSTHFCHPESASKLKKNLCPERSLFWIRKLSLCGKHCWDAEDCWEGSTIISITKSHPWSHRWATLDGVNRICVYSYTANEKRGCEIWKRARRGLWECLRVGKIREKWCNYLGHMGGFWKKEREGEMM